ncbi:hypothetical protein N7540_002630 [Penicillium herquei]|nr:hypothetical protein N7540_002630 [Penicillium herquei]
MATPDNIKIDNLNGIWILNKKHSSNLEGILKLVRATIQINELHTRRLCRRINHGQTDIWKRIQQKISWLLRKAMPLTDICLEISTSHAPLLEDNKPVVTIDFLQTPTIGNLASISENRTLDWEERSHSDYFFGDVIHRSCFVRGFSGTGDAISIRPDFELQIKPLHACMKQFLGGEIFITKNEETSSSTPDGFLLEVPSNGHDDSQGLWVHTHEKGLTSSWEAEQIWGFEMIDGKRHFTRRVVVTRPDGQYICGRLVYDFQS